MPGVGITICHSQARERMTRIALVRNHLIESVAECRLGSLAVPARFCVMSEDGLSSVNGAQFCAVGLSPCTELPLLLELVRVIFPGRQYFLC